MTYFIAPYTLPSLEVCTLSKLRMVLKKHKVVALDTETQGDKIIMLQLALGADEYVVDTRFEDPSPILRDLQDKLVVAHNVKFDYKMLRLNYGIVLNNVWDTMLASQILNCGRSKPKGYHSLEQVVQRHIDAMAYTPQTSLFQEVVTKKVRSTFADQIGEFTLTQVQYGAMDARYTLLLHSILEKLIKEQELEATMDLDNKFVLVAADMELTGLPIRIDKWENNAKTSEELVAKLEQTLLEVSPINWNSSAQVVKLFKSLGISPKLVDKETGEEKDSVSALAIASSKITDPIVKTYLEYKKAKKLNTSYGLKFLENVSSRTGRIHTNIFQILATGRTASSDINVQNIPRDSRYRDCFEAPSERTLIMADYANQEVRVLADLAEDANMLEACLQSDVHLATAKIAFSNPNLTKASEERQYAKSMNFLIA